MLKLCENYEELKGLPANPFCAAITALAKTHGFDREYFRVYISDNACLSVLDGNITLHAQSVADYDELKSFLGFLGFRSVLSDEETIKALGLKAVDSSFIVKYAGTQREKPAGFTGSFDAREAYHLLTECGFDTGDFESFCLDIVKRLNKGTARFAGIDDGGRLDSCAFTLFDGEKSSLLGAVATDEAKRGRGYAGSLVSYLAGKNKESFLYCRNDSLLEFYKKYGFEYWGRWAKASR